ncbi:MAG: hypothetical protein WAJ92_09315 [Candidatus Acidiferrales bacterium]
MQDAFNTYAYMNGQILAQYENSTVYFHHHDQVGSTRLVTELNQGIEQCIGYYPFGELDSERCTPMVSAYSRLAHLHRGLIFGVILFSYVIIEALIRTFG